jgi:alcohol dehydrogenase (cytochrome c)
MNNTCMDYTLKPVVPKVGAYHDSASYVPLIAPGAEGKVGRVEAVDVATGRTLWKHEQRAVWYGSLLATGGGLVFGGDVDRWLNAFDASTGKILWRTRLAMSAQGYPVTYEVNGRQYLAVPAGVALGIPTLTPEIRVPTSGSLLYVFAIQE